MRLARISNMPFCCENKLEDNILVWGKPGSRRRNMSDNNNNSKTLVAKLVRKETLVLLVYVEVCSA